MPKSHRVRLADGSVIDLDRSDLRTWYERGLINADTPVQASGSARWGTLRDVIDVRAARAPANRAAARPVARSTPGPAATREPAPPSRETLNPELWKKAVIGFAAVALVVLVAATSGSWWPPLQGLLGEDELARGIRAAATTDRSFSDEAQGLALELPDGWLALRPEQPLFRAPAEARLALGAPKPGVLAYLVLEPRPRGDPSLDAFLDRVIAAGRGAGLTPRESGREDVRVAGQPGRRASGPVERGGEAFHASVTAWRDGWSYAALVAFAPGTRAERAGRAVEALLAGAVSRGLGERVREAVRRAAHEAPILTARAAELVMSQSAAGVLEPPEAFRRAYNLVGQAIPRLSAAENRELGALHTALYAAVPARQRGRLGVYIGRVRGRQATSPDEDREMADAMRAAVARLPEPRRARLQQLIEKSISVAVAGAGA